MAEVLEYKYHPGDVLRYRYTVTAVLEQPEDETCSLTCTFNGCLAALETQEFGGEHLFALELRLDPIEIEGMLKEFLGGELTDQVVRFRKKSTGELPPGQVVPALVNCAIFPREPVGDGHSWITLFDTPRGPLEVRYVVKAFHGAGRETAAQVVCESQWDDESEQCTGLTESAYSFSVTHGHIIESTTVTEMVWDSGEKLSAVVEVCLTERSPAL